MVASFRRSSRTQFWPHGICAASCCTISRSGHASAKAHVLEIASRVTRELRKRPLKVVGKTVDDIRAPALAFLTSQDIASNFPIMQDKLGIGCERGFDLGCPDAILDRLDEPVIKLCSRLVHN